MSVSRIKPERRATVALLGGASVLVVCVLLRTALPAGAARDEARAASDPQPAVIEGSPPLAAEPAPQDPTATTAGQRDFTLRSAAETEPSGVFSDTTLAGRALNAYMQADLVSERGAEGKRQHAAALEQLREQSAEALPLLEKTYHALPSTDYPTRERVVQILSDMSVHRSAPLLAEIAEQPLPPVTPDQDGHDRTQQLEAMVRFTALEGLRDLSARGNESAAQALERVIRNGDPLLRKEAVSLYLETDGDLRAQQAKVAGMLAEEERWMAHRLTLTGRGELPVVTPPADSPELVAKNISGPKYGPATVDPRGGAAGSGPGGSMEGRP